MNNPYLAPKANVSNKKHGIVKFPFKQLSFWVAMLLLLIFLVLKLNSNIVFSRKDVYEIFIGFLVMPVLALIITPFFKIFYNTSYVSSYIKSLEYCSLILGSMLLILNFLLITTLSVGATDLPEAIEIIRSYF